MLKRIKDGYIKVMRYIIGVKINVIEDNNIKVDGATTEYTCVSRLGIFKMHVIIDQRNSAGTEFKYHISIYVFGVKVVGFYTRDRYKRSVYVNGVVTEFKPLVEDESKLRDIVIKHPDELNLDGNDTISGSPLFVLNSASRGPFRMDDERFYPTQKRPLQNIHGICIPNIKTSVDFPVGTTEETPTPREKPYLETDKFDGKIPVLDMNPNGPKRMIPSAYGYPKHGNIKTSPAVKEDSNRSLSRGKPTTVGADSNISISDDVEELSFMRPTHMISRDIAGHRSYLRQSILGVDISSVKTPASADYVNRILGLLGVETEVSYDIFKESLRALCLFKPYHTEANPATVREILFDNRDTMLDHQKILLKWYICNDGKSAIYGNKRLKEYVIFIREERSKLFPNSYKQGNNKFISKTLFTVKHDSRTYFAYSTYGRATNLMVYLMEYIVELTMFEGYDEINKKNLFRKVER